jgi:hypothetical protein
MNALDKNLYANTNMEILRDLQDFMLTPKNINLYTKHMFKKDLNSKSQSSIPNKIIINNTSKKNIQDTYQPQQKDSLFWCFYILKYGYSNYEMEINNQYFTIEKNQKYKYVNIFRDKKDLLKMHKIKPLSDLEVELTSDNPISIKTFFALCIVENINVLIIDKRKYYELILNDDTKCNIIHKNRDTKEHYIEVNVTEQKIDNYKKDYYKMSNFDEGLKTITSYKLEDLVEICRQLNININKDNTKKKTKKELYELIIANL